MKTLYVTQAKQLLKLFEADLVQMVNGLIKINKDLQIDYSFIDKILQNMSVIDKDTLLDAIKKVGIT